jgi:hypothetical protein
MFETQIFCEPQLLRDSHGDLPERHENFTGVHDNLTDVHGN